jgi:anti-sigma regulatory factor (Ser/Thr protein kinase)
MRDIAFFTRRDGSVRAEITWSFSDYFDERAKDDEAVLEIFGDESLTLPVLGCKDKLCGKKSVLNFHIPNVRLWWPNGYGKQEFYYARVRLMREGKALDTAVRRFAGEFIDRRIALDYTPVEWETVTDGKWLTFVVEQLLSNALKYTGQDGTVQIYREGDDLCIRDSGMGIAPEDLPRVFDMGYTGQNGRLDRRSSGIGLYLCRRICRNLRHEIRIESVPGVGTTVYLTLGRGDFLPE